MSSRAFLPSDLFCALLLSLCLAASGCERKPATSLLVTSFEEPAGRGSSWGGGTVHQGQATEGRQCYEVVFGDAESGLFSRPGALPRELPSYRKLLLDVQGPTAPFLVYLTLSGPSKDPPALYQDVWVPLGASTLEFDLSPARASKIDLKEMTAIRIGPQNPDEREVRVFIDNVRLSMAGSAAPPMPQEGTGEGGAESLVPQSGFEEGFGGWTPWTWGAGRAIFALARGSDAFRGSASAGIFHRADGRAGLLSPVLELPPGRYRLLAGVRALGTAEIRVDLREAQSPRIEKDFPVGAFEASEDWAEKSLDVEVPPEGPGQETVEGPRPLQFLFTSEKGDFFLDELILLPRPPTEGGSRAAPPRPKPPIPKKMDVLVFDPAGPRAAGLADARSSCADLSPAALGGGPSAGVLRFAERIAGDPGVRFWLIGSSADSVGFGGGGATLGTTPAEIRAARSSLSAAGRPTAVAVRPDRPGAVETFADTADIIVGGIPLRVARLSAGLATYAEGLDALRRGGDLVSWKGPAGFRRPAAAWIDVRTKPGVEPASPGELRAMVYLALVHGCDAAVVAPFEGERGAPELRAELDRVAGKLAEAAPDLAGLTDAGPIEVTDRRIHARIVRTSTGRALILVNTAPASVEKFHLRLPAEAAPGTIERSLGPCEGWIERLSGR